MICLISLWRDTNSKPRKKYFKKIIIPKLTKALFQKKKMLSCYISEFRIVTSRGFTISEEIEINKLQNEESKLGWSFGPMAG